MTKSISTIAHFIPRGMLVLALGRWPYGYHMLLRVVVFASGLLIATLIYQRMKDFTAWVVVFLIAAIIFNPILPLHLTRSVWSTLNVIAAALFVTHWLVVRESVIAASERPQSR